MAALCWRKPVMTRFTRWPLNLGICLLIAGTAYQAVMVEHSSSSWASRFNAVGFSSLAARLYHYNVSNFPAQAPRSAFEALARRRADSDSLVEVADLAALAGH